MTYISQVIPKKTQFDEQITSSKRQIINLKSIYGLSALRDVQTTTGSATIANATGEYKLTTTVNGDDKAILESAERGRYYAGQDAQAGIGVRISDTPTGNQVSRWGYYDDNDGFGFGVDATDLFIFDRKGGTETKVYQSNWNVDKLDGTGSSGLNLTIADGAIYHINFSWYGYGTIVYEVVYFDSTTKEQKSVIVHRIRKTSSVSIEDPNLPIRAEIENATTGAIFDSMYVGGRQFSTFGDLANPRRITSERNLNLLSIGNTPVPLVSFRRKSAFESISVKVSDLDIITNFDAIIDVRLDTTLTGASFGTPTNYSASETALESDTSATAVSGGEILYSTLVVSAGSGNSQKGGGSLNLIEQDFVGLQPVTVTIRQVEGTGGTASCIFRAGEEW